MVGLKRECIGGVVLRVVGGRNRTGREARVKTKELLHVRRKASSESRWCDE